MSLLMASSSSAPFLQNTTTHSKTLSTTKPRSPFLHFNPKDTAFFSNIKPTPRSKTSKLYTNISSSSSSVTAEPTSPIEPELGTDTEDEKFEWYSQWYPVMPVRDLDKRKPHAKKVMGLDVVVWWDRNENEWKVFDDTCPHRLAPLSEGRIDKWGRLQCVYHGWCFDGSGDCKLIPQAPLDGPPVHTFKKACVAAYPTIVHHDIVWFWPNSDPEYKDIILKKKPPSIPELDDPSFSIGVMGNRDFPYGYEVLIENLMDPAHVPYAHYGIAEQWKSKVKVDREGGSPLEINVEKFDLDGFVATHDWGTAKFLPPFISIFNYNLSPSPDPGNGSASPAEDTKPSLSVPQKRKAFIFLCMPVSPGNSRVIWIFPKNFGVWIDRIVPQWMFHMGANLVLDSDLYLLHVEERKIMDIGSYNWQKACFLPTKSDALVVAFRRWLNKYGGGQVDWKGKYSGALPPSPPREQLMDRYWSHVVNCSCCRTAYKGLNAVEVALQVISLAALGIVAALKQNAMSAAARSSVVVMALVCFATSRWLAHFTHKNFRLHDYNHAFR